MPDVLVNTFLFVFLLLIHILLIYMSQVKEVGRQREKYFYPPVHKQQWISDTLEFLPFQLEKNRGF